MSDRAAEAAVAELPSGGGPVEVTGAGELAAALRARLGPRSSHGSGAPGAAIDTTGDPTVIRELLARVADLGTVVLAAPSPSEDVEIDFYADVHVRGLTLKAVAPPRPAR